MVFALDEILYVNDMISGKTIIGHLTEPLRAPANARVTLLEMPVGTPVFLNAIFVGITAAEIKRSRSGNNMNPNVRLELDHVVVNGSPLALRAGPLDRHAIAFPWAQLPGKDDPKRSVVVQANERLEMNILETYLSASGTSPEKPQPPEIVSADHRSTSDPQPNPETISEPIHLTLPANVHLCIDFARNHACNLLHREGTNLVGRWPKGDVSHMELEQFTTAAAILSDTVRPSHNKPAVHTVYKAM